MIPLLPQVFLRKVLRDVACLCTINSLSVSQKSNRGCAERQATRPRGTSGAREKRRPGMPNLIFPILSSRAFPILNTVRQ